MVQKWDKRYPMFVKTAKHLTEEKQGEKRENAVKSGYLRPFPYNFSNLSEIRDKKVRIFK